MKLSPMVYKTQAKWMGSRGHAFGKEGVGFVRVNIGCPRARLKTALEQLLQALSGF